MNHGELQEENDYKNLDAALQDLNDGIKRWCDENGIDLDIGEE